MTSVNEESSRSERERLRCFVIGPIGSELADAGSEARQRYEEALQVVEEVIVPACEEVGLTPIRADGLTQAGEITEQVFRRLRDDDVVIADLTGANANVMYELGLRHTRDALTLQIGEYDRLPFDITVIRTIQFSRSPYGLIKARRRLVEMLETGLAGEYDPVTATRIWNQPDSIGVSVRTPQLPEGEDQPAEDETSEPPGFVDLIAEAEQYQQLLSDATNAIAARMAELGSAAEEATQRTAQSDARGAGMQGRLAVIAQFANEVNSIGEQLESNVNDYESAMAAVSAGTIALIERIEEDPSQLRDAMDFGQIVRRLAMNAREALESQQVFTATLRENARASRVLRQPVRRVTNALDRFAAATQSMDEWDRRLQALGVPVPPEDWEFPDSSGS